MTRIVIRAVLVLALLVPVAAQAATARYELRVDGLACPFCSYGIEKNLLRTKGVAGVDIDIDGGTVTVTMAEGAMLTEAEAKRIVKDAGFTLAGFRKLPEVRQGAAD